jgi:diketogulonate reductase-like aldo/keto reductase
MTPAQIPTISLPNGEMPLLGLGTWQSEGNEAELAVAAALELGYTHIDTATGYGNQAEVGRALSGRDMDRDAVFLTTKLPPDHAGRERQTLMESLAELHTDHLDLWLIHWPPNKQATPATWEQFIAARDEGLVRNIGVSNYSIAQIDELIAATGEAPAVNQIPWSPGDYDAELVAEHERRGVKVEGYSPFKRTDLEDPVLTAIAEAHGVSTRQVVLRWHIDHGVVVIPKSTNPERIKQNLDVLGFSLSADELAQIDGLGGR